MFKTKYYGDIYYVLCNSVFIQTHNDSKKSKSVSK
jgi:hypothetical protein